MMETIYNLEDKMFKIFKKFIQYPRLTLKYPDQPLNTANIHGRPSISLNSCVSCGKCVASCPVEAIVFNSKNYPRIHLDKCIFCYTCAEVCPAFAIHITEEFELAEKNPLALRGERELAEKISRTSHELFGRSLQIREIDAGSCNGCDYEINGLNNPFNDIERFGIHFVASPRHADMLLVTGPVTHNMTSALLRTYEATPDPKLVVAVGACACSGGIFRDCYAVHKGIGSLLPIDIYIPGCPPRPQAILYGILKALDRHPAKPIANT